MILTKRSRHIFAVDEAIALVYRRRKRLARPLGRLSANWWKTVLSVLDV